MTTPQHLTLASVFAALRATVHRHRLTHDSATIISAFAPNDPGPPQLRVIVSAGICAEIVRAWETPIIHTSAEACAAEVAQILEPQP